MSEMDQCFDDLLDAIFDSENNDNIILVGDDGQEIAFEQVALIPIEGAAYVILSPLQQLEGVEDGQGLVFMINMEAKSFELVCDQGIIDSVFDVYEALLDAEGEEDHEQ